MRRLNHILAAALLLGVAAFASPQQPASAPPAWAYTLNPPDDRALADDDGLPHRVPGSSKALTRTQVLDTFNVPDWHPDGHPPMPEIVEHGRPPGVRGCGFCHLPNAQGRPENAGLAGLNADYIVQQVMDIKSGARKCSEPRMFPPQMMVIEAQNVSVEEARIAAAYFASLKPKSWVRVVETNTVPKTQIKGSMHVPIEGGGTEPLGQRIIEAPENWDRTELRDDASGFVAYVPVGSVEKGAAIVSGGSGKTTRCSICHGTDLRGLGPVPRLAGRSPTYLFRQLYDLQHGSRHGEWSALMQAPVARLSEEDMLDISAYLGSLDP